MLGSVNIRSGSANSGDNFLIREVDRMMRKEIQNTSSYKRMIPKELILSESVKPGEAGMMNA